MQEFKNIFSALRKIFFSEIVGARKLYTVFYSWRNPLEVKRLRHFFSHPSETLNFAADQQWQFWPFFKSSPTHPLTIPDTQMDLEEFFQGCTMQGRIYNFSVLCT